MEKHKAEQFMNQIYKWNHNQSQIFSVIFVLMGTFAVMLINAVSMDYTNVGTEGNNVFWIVSAIIFAGIFYTQSFFDQYVMAVGKDGKTRQSILDTIAYQPFSLDTYLKVLRRKYAAGGVILICLSVLVLVCGAFSRVIERETEYSVEYNIQQMEGMTVTPYMIAVVMVGIILFAVTCSISFLVYRKQLQYQMRSRKNSKRKNEKTQMIKKKELLLAGCLIAIITWLTTQVVINDIILPEDYGMEWVQMVHTDVINLLTSAWIINVSAIMDENNRKHIKKLVTFFIIVGILCIGYSVTYYNCYYEDHFEIHTLFGTKSYTWDEVESYEVSGSMFRESVQLELQMEGDSVKVFVGETVRSDKHDEQYLTDYHYVLALMEKMDAYGIPGIIYKPERLEKYANKHLEEEREEVLEVVEKMKNIAVEEVGSFFFSTYTTDDVADYGNFEGHIDYEKEAMFTGLFILPEDVENAQIEEYHYKCRVSIFDNDYRLYSKIRYKEEDFQKEKERLASIVCTVDGTEQYIQYSDTAFQYPAYITVDGHNHVYEYALLDEENQSVIYVYTQFFELSDFVPKEYRPLEYDAELDMEDSWNAYSIYYKYDEELDGYIFYGDGE